MDNTAVKGLKSICALPGNELNKNSKNIQNVEKEDYKYIKLLLFN